MPERAAEHPSPAVTLDAVFKEPIVINGSDGASTVISRIREILGLQDKPCEIVGCQARRYQKGIGVAFRVKINGSDHSLTEEVLTLDIVDQQLVPRVLGVFPFVYADSDVLCQKAIESLRAANVLVALVPEGYQVRQQRTSSIPSQSNLR